MKKITVAEQVTKYHPDKYADQIADKIAYYALRQNPQAKTAIEVMVKDDIVIVAGEISGFNLKNEKVEELVKIVAKELDYKVGYVLNFIGEQSTEIKNAVEQKEIGAGDQGIVYGYASNFNSSYLSNAMHIANKITERIESLVWIGVLKGDGKTIVTTEDNKVTQVLISVCHETGWELDDIKTYIELLMYPIYQENKTIFKEDYELIVNPAGLWTVGGPTADTGLTGRKIVADQYGTGFNVGGGAFSGKDLTKIDRSGAYVARNVAKELISKKIAQEVFIQVSYGIGISKPLSISVKDQDNNDLSKHVDVKRFEVANMIEELKYLDLYEISKGCHFK